MPSQDDDGLDESAWERLRIVVMAACSGDREAFSGEMKSWGSDSPLDEQRRIGLYLFAAVKYMVKVFVQGDPSEADLKRLAARCLPDVQKVLPVHPDMVEDALRAVFDMPFIRSWLVPGELVVLSAALAGALLNQLGAGLQEIRGWVAEWWRVNSRTIHDVGVLDK